MERRRATSRGLHAGKMPALHIFQKEMRDGAGLLMRDGAGLLRKGTGLLFSIKARGWPCHTQRYGVTFGENLGKTIK